MAETITLRGRKVVGGVAEGEALVTRDRISGWGGVDPRTGTIVETRHELRGRSFAGKVLVFPGAKGSSGWSAQFHLARVHSRAARAEVLAASGRSADAASVAAEMLGLCEAKGDVADSKAIAWRFDRDTPYVPSPLLYGDELYLLKSNDGMISCFDARTGERHYGPERLPEVGANLLREGLQILP